MQKQIVILGVTGSIGTQALDIVRSNPEKYKVVGISAGGNNIQLLKTIAQEFDVEKVAIANESAARSFKLANTKIFVGEDAATELASQKVDVVLNGIAGAVGLGPTVATLKAGSTLALANKESLVIGGKAVTCLAKPGQIVPVDSEHSALAQCLRSGERVEVKKLILTASGGPFRGYSKAQLETVSAKEALNHPTWSMGPVVTINSSTLMNKGLEIIEAHLLFGIPMDQIQVVVHPQSIVHSMVEFIDGSTIAQASPPDMHLPIALGLSWPDRLADVSTSCDWSKSATWTFEPVDEEVFPAVNLAKLVGSKAGTCPAVMNGANEVAVGEFLKGTIKYSEIVNTVSQIVELHLSSNYVSDENLTIEEVIKAAKWANDATKNLITSGVS